MLIVHVPDDPVMINKKYLPSKESSVDGWVKAIKKLSIPSVISGNVTLRSDICTSSFHCIFTNLDDSNIPQIILHISLYLRK